MRLALFLLSRILLWGEDHRFDDQRNNIVRLSLFWTIQGDVIKEILLKMQEREKERKRKRKRRRKREKEKDKDKRERERERMKSAF